MTHEERMNKVAVLKAAKTKKDVAKTALTAEKAKGLETLKGIAARVNLIEKTLGAGE